MARQIELTNWELSGTPVFGHEADVRTPISMPFYLHKALEMDEGPEGEWTLLRRWSLKTSIERPDEPEEGRSERYFVKLTDIRGEGDVFAAGTLVGRIEDGCVEISQAILSGSCELELIFDPRPAMGFAGLPAIARPPLLCATYFARFVQVGARAGEKGSLTVSSVIEGYGEGRVKLLYRLLYGDTLVSTQTAEIRLTARRQSVLQKMEVVTPALWPSDQGEQPVYTLYVTMERGGARSDMAVLSISFRELYLDTADTPALCCGDAKTPLLGFVPREDSMTCERLQKYKSFGFNAALFEQLPLDISLSHLDRAGLFAHVAVPENQQTGMERWLQSAAGHVSLLSAGYKNLRFADGSAADERHPAIYALSQALQGKGLSMLNLPRPSIISGRLAIPSQGGYEQALQAYEKLALLRKSGHGFFIKDLDTLIFREDLRFTQAAGGIKSALSKLILHAACTPDTLYPGALFEAELSLLGDVEGVALAKAELYALDGTLLKEDIYSLCAKGKGLNTALFQTQLPWGLSEALILRLSIIKGDTLLWRWDKPLLCGIESLSALEKTQIHLAKAGGTCYAVNRGKVAALGLMNEGDLSIYALLPGERVLIDEIGGEGNFTLGPLEEWYVSG